MSFEIPIVQTDDVIIQYSNKIVKIIGSIDFLNPKTFMAPFFDELHEKIIKNKVKEITVDFTELNFLNSSGVKEFVSWIMKIFNVSNKEKYLIKFIYSSFYEWQEKSLLSLKSIYPSCISIEKKK